MHFLLALLRLLCGLAWFSGRELQLIEVREDGTTRVRRVSSMRGVAPLELGRLTPILALFKSIARTWMAGLRARRRPEKGRCGRRQSDI